MKRTLNDRILKALKPKRGAVYDVMDAIVPGFGVRVSEKGRRTFILIGRFPGSPKNPLTGYANPTRLALGEYGTLTLEAARDKARAWIALIRKGIDPREQQESEKLAEQRKRGNSFRAVAEEFIRLAVIGPDPESPKQRKGLVVKREIENEFIARWGGRPITSITAHDVIMVLDEAVARGAPYQAHNLLGHVRRLFNWAIARGVYGLDRSPCDRMKPRDVIGPKALRTRVLTDSELRALWKASEALPYPYGPLFRMLAWIGQRKSEVAEAKWSEFDLHRKLWVIPSARMKADAPHIIPLTEDVLALLASLPRFNKGDHLFSLTGGKAPVNGFGKAKDALDAAMLATMREGLDEKAAKKIKLEGFVIHDIRRSMRTGLSALPISTEVAELVIGHTKPGLRKVYDQHLFIDEKRRALELWAARLRDIVTPPPPNVVSMTKARG